MLESKCVFEVGNLAASAMLFFLLRKSSTRSVVSENTTEMPCSFYYIIFLFQKTRLVKLTLTLEIFLSTIPSFAVWLFSLYVGKPIADYIGPVGYTATMLEVCLCAFCYHWILYKRIYRRKMIANAAAAHDVQIPMQEEGVARERPPPLPYSTRQRPGTEPNQSSSGGIMYGRSSSTPALSAAPPM